MMQMQMAISWAQAGMAQTPTQPHYEGLGLMAELNNFAFSSESYFNTFYFIWSCNNSSISYIAYISLLNTVVLEKLISHFITSHTNFILCALWANLPLIDSHL